MGLPYGTVNIALLQEVKKHILEEPSRFDMNTWWERCDNVKFPNNSPPCGTVACLAGWAVALDRKARGIANFNEPPSSLNGYFSVEGEAARVLNISADYTLPGARRGHYNPFHVDQWPEEYRLRYREAITTAEHAQVAADFIDYMCGLKEKQ